MIIVARRRRCFPAPMAWHLLATMRRRMRRTKAFVSHLNDRVLLISELIINFILRQRLSRPPRTSTGVMRLFSWYLVRILDTKIEYMLLRCFTRSYNSLPGQAI